MEELVRHFAAFYPAPRDPDEMIAAVGLEDKRHTRTRQLSGGQRRRLGVALGVVGRPELLFLDEPTTGFDPEARRAFWGLFRGLRVDGTTILLTTHYLEEAEHLADRVAVISGGHIVGLGTPSELGGRADQEATVVWEDAEGRHEVRTQTPTRLVTELGSRSTSGEIPGLQVLRPTLEDVYLLLIHGSARAEPPDSMAASLSSSPAKTGRGPVAPSVLTLAVARTNVELKQFFRERDAVIFIFAFPVIILAIFGSVFTDDVGGGVTFTEYFVPGSWLWGSCCRAPVLGHRYRDRTGRRHAQKG